MTGTRTTYLTLDSKGRATLPDEVRESLGVGPGDFVQLRPTDHGTYELVPAVLVPREDLWHFHPEFQKRLARADAETVAGRVTVLGSPSAAQSVLDRWKKRPAASAPNSSASPPRSTSKSGKGRRRGA